LPLVLPRDMDLHGYLNRTTFQTLKLTSTPTCSSSRFLSPSLHKTKTSIHKFPFPRLTKALSTSSAAVQTSPTTTTTISDDQGHSFPSFLNSLFQFLSHSLTMKLVVYVGGKPQWKATIDFKWIKDNKETVAVNIKNRNSDANLELILHLYDKLFILQKVMFLFFLFIIHSLLI